MPNFYRFILLVLLLSGAALRSYGQQTGPLISGSFENLRFAEFVRRVEAATPYRFYYNATDVDSLTVNLTATGQPLSQVLTQALTGSKLLASVDAAGHVFISAAPGIQTKLMPGFFDAPTPHVAASQLTDPAAGVGWPPPGSTRWVGASPRRPAARLPSPAACATLGRASP